MSNLPHSITFDFETRSYADLKAVGAWRYSEHETTDVICACWGVDDQPIQEWVPGDRPPRDLFELIRAGVPVEAHNVSFELSIWHNVMAKRYGWILPLDDQWLDTAAVARYYALPGALDRLARALGFEGKDPEGGRLISRYSKLNLKNAKPVIPPEDLRKFIDYCRKDVMIEQSISDYLGDLPEREMPYFHFDRRMNMRGIHLDREGIAAATAIVDQRSQELTEKFEAITGLAPTKVAKLMGWFAEQGCPLENLQAEQLEELLENGDLPKGPARDAITLRLQIAKASTKKLDAMDRAVGNDGRSHFATLYHGAQTGRNTGTLWQPLNLRHSMEDVKPERLVRDIMHGEAAWLDTLYGDAMEAVAQATRHWIKAQPGNKIVAVDFVSIEAVVLACMAGEDWKVQAFRDKIDLYCLMGDVIYGYPEGTCTKKTHPSERQDGKRGELAFGYQGALGAWLKFDPFPIHTDERIIEICKIWRKRHPMIVAYWYDMERAAIECVQTGQPTQCRMIGFDMQDEWLSMILPTGKRIWYFKPELRAGMPKWHTPAKEKLEDGSPNPCNLGTCDCKPRAFLTYMAQKEGQWRRVSTYGGKLVENATQATSREILMPAALAAEAAGYPVILTVYDEVVTEPPIGFGSAKELEQIMVAAVPEFAKSWPIRADGWSGERYKK